ncbi:MAG TPA: acyl-CoA dehydrogenase, partial [Rhodobiaceae bacterium]|nr:acyl-CoA dehydrogenase [Rhodobiaceae bacterium]
MAIDFSFPEEVEVLRTSIRNFIDEVVKPIEEAMDEDDRASVREGVIKMRTEAYERGLWLPHMPEAWGGMDLGHVELAMISAEAARSRYGPFAINCQAPDEGNMHTLLKWGTDEQKDTYLRPMCEGRKFSCFAMTEPEVAG